MPNKTNYHCHSLFCDGRADMNDFLRFAIAEGYSSCGFSSHAPLPFSTAWTMEWDRMEDYLNEFRRLKQRYAGVLELCIGLEIDYLGDESNASKERFQQLPLDFRIGSVHLLPDEQGQWVDIDCPPESYRQIVDYHFHGDVEQVVRLYYHQLACMLEKGGFDIVGHPDKMHYNASTLLPDLLDQPWYDALVRSYFARIVELGYVVEVNTKAYHTAGTFFPNARYFGYLHQLGARMMVNSDAHYPDLLSNGRAEALEALRRAGFTSVVEWHHAQWQDVPLAPSSL